MRIKNIRTLINKLFAEFNIYFGINAGSYENKGYKINYQIPNTFDLEGQREYRIEFDIYSKDSIKVEEISDLIEEKINYSTFYENGESATFIFDTRYQNDGKNEYRRTLVYEVRTY